MNRIILVVLLVLIHSISHAEQYNRGKFPHWLDFNNDGIDARQEILIRDLVGGIFCPYSGVWIKDLRQSDIDHIVPLKWAWNNGADAWDEQKRIAFANDPENLLAVSRATNRSKSFYGPENWLPPNIYFIPEYVQKFIHVCEKYGLPYDKSLYRVIVSDALKKSKGIRN